MSRIGKIVFFFLYLELGIVSKGFHVLEIWNKLEYQEIIISFIGFESPLFAKRIEMKITHYCALQVI